MISSELSEITVKAEPKKKEVEVKKVKKLS
jgi:hypothetical protein